MKNNNKEKKWSITLTEEQLCMMCAALEDWHRFLCGQCELDYATSYISPCESMHRVRDILSNEVKPTMFPELSRGESYSWNGGHPNPHLNKAQAMSYMLYREIKHNLALACPSKHYNIYNSETLTCEEQGPMIKVKPVNDNNNEGRICFV